MSAMSSTNKAKSVQSKNIDAPRESKRSKKRVSSAPIMKPKMLEVTERCTSLRDYHSSPTNDAFASDINCFARRHKAMIFNSLHELIKINCHRGFIVFTL